ncbi:MAG: HU family DNA-binding protein [Pseudomonadota bacterium]
MVTKTASKTATKPASKAKTKSTTKTSSKAASTPTAARKTSAASKAGAPSAASAKSASAAAPKVSVVTDAQSTPVGAELKKRELVDLVVQRSDVKKKFAKPVVEALLEVLGEAIAEERALNLQPMGRVMPKRTKDAGKNRVVIARIRQSKERAAEAAAAHAQNQAVAKAAE